MNLANIDNLFAYLEEGNAIDSSHVTHQELYIFHALCCELLNAVIDAIMKYQHRLCDELQTHEISRKVTNCTRMLKMLNMLKVVVTSDTDVLRKNVGSDQQKQASTTISWSGVLGLTVLHGTSIYNSEAYKSGDTSKLAQLLIDKNKDYYGFPLAEAWQFVQLETDKSDIDKLCNHALDVITCACKLIPNHELQSG